VMNHLAVAYNEAGQTQKRTRSVAPAVAKDNQISLRTSN